MMMIIDIKKFRVVLLTLWTLLSLVRAQDPLSLTPDSETTPEKTTITTSSPDLETTPEKTTVTTSSCNTCSKCNH